MSKEFEEIVLKKLEKLDNIEKEVKNNSQRLGNLETEVGTLNTEVSSLKAEVGSLGTEVGSLKIKVGSLETEMGSLKTAVGKLEMEVKNTGEVVNYLNQRFTKFDYEINQKIDTLFDAFATNGKKDLVHEKEIASLNARVFNQDIRISNLEDKVLIA